MPVEIANGVAESLSVPNGDLKSQNPNAAAKKSRETERRRRRRKQKKNKHSATNGDDSDTAAEDADGVAHDSSKENSDPQKVLKFIERFFLGSRVRGNDASWCRNGIKVLACRTYMNGKLF